MARRRRSAEEARAEMIGAATALLAQHGPEGVKLDDVAAEVGVSRQAVLHHFKNRAGLMRAVVEVAWLGLFRDLAAMASSADGLAPDAFVDLVDDTVRRKGNARIGAWLLLSGKGLPEEVFEGALASLPDAVHVQRGEGSPEDTRFALLLVASALFGDAIFGVRLRQALGMPDGEDERAAFRHWVAERVWG